MSTVKTNNVQVGQSGTATNNFTVYQPSTPDGTVRIGVGNSGATTLDVVTVSNAGNMTVTGTVNATTVTAAAVTSTSTPIPIASGGTGQVTQQAAINALTGTQTANRVLRSDGTDATLSQVALTTDVTGTLPVANGGTGAATLTANNVILGNGTSAVAFVAPSTSGNVLTSNGTTWTSASSYAGPNSQLFTANGTFTVPANITRVRITVVAGGGGGGGCAGSACGQTEGGMGGFGGSSIAYVTGLTPGGTISITVGAAGSAGSSASGAGGTGGTSSAASNASATGGGGGNYNQTGGAATPGTGSLGRFNARWPTEGGNGSTLYGYNIRRTTAGAGTAGVGYGAGGAGGWSNNNGNQAGGAGAPGMVMVEW